MIFYFDTLYFTPIGWSFSQTKFLSDCGKSLIYYNLELIFKILKYNTKRLPFEKTKTII